jgi:hypothetical protein
MYWDEMSNPYTYRGPSIDASYQVSVHLDEGFHRRKLKCEKLMDNPLGQFTSNFTELLELMVLRSVYFMVKFRLFIQELWDFIHQIVGDFSYVAL